MMLRPRGHGSQLVRAMRRSRWRQGTAWLRPRWVSLTGAAACFALSLGLLTSPRFRVEQVVVRRHSASAEAAITRASQLSQVVGHNIFLVNTDRVAREVAQVPSVLTARVIPRLPNVVEIELVERVPIAVWHTAGGSLLVDDQGFVLAPASDAAGGPTDPGFAIHDTTGRELRPGDHVDQRALLAARELAKALPAAGASVAEVEYAPQGLVLVTEGGWRVIVGGADGLNAKLANLAGIVEVARSQNLRLAVVDLRPKDRPFYQVAP
jgi:cell division protein FtsQ